MRKIIPPSIVIRNYALVWMSAYLVLYFFLRGLLPEKYLRDSMTIQKLADDAHAADWGGAYNIAAIVAGSLPMWAINILVAATGCFTIWLVVTSLRSLRGMAIIPFILLPTIILDLVQFGKEIFIIPVTFFILRLAEKVSSGTKVFFVIAAIYLVYGVFFREYYLIILAAFTGILITVRSPPPFRVFYLLLLLAVLVVVPSHLFMDLQGSRDAINRWSNMVTNEVRTAIYNPYIPDNGFHFVLNYLYVFLKLNVPLIFDHTMNEVILTVNILFYGYMIYVGVRRRPVTPLNMLSWLFLSHVLVLAIFEPDSGSYFRHFSSVIVYIVPALRMVEQRYAERVLHDAAPEPE